MYNTFNTREEFFTEAFTDPVTRKPEIVPADLRRVSERLCMSYGIFGICDPMYIVNVIAMETGRGDGQGHFETIPNGYTVRHNMQNGNVWDVSHPEIGYCGSFKTWAEALEYCKKG